MYYFVNTDRWWNIFDFTMVTSIIVEHLIYAQDYNNPLFLRFFRVARGVRRVFKIARLAKHINDLKVIVQCIIGSAFSMTWCILALAGFSLVYAIFICQQFAEFLSENQSVDIESRTLISSSFGSVQPAVLTLFKCVSGGSDWGPEYELVAVLGQFNSIVFLSYMVMVWFSLANIITSIFVQKAMDCAQPGAHARALEQLKCDLDKARELASLFRMISGRSDHISATHLAECLQDVQVRSFFEVNGLDVTDIDTFLGLLTDGLEDDGQTIHLDTLVTGCLSLKGPARSIDLVSAGHRLIHIDGMLRRALQMMERQL